MPSGALNPGFHLQDDPVTGRVLLEGRGAPLREGGRPLPRQPRRARQGGVPKARTAQSPGTRVLPSVGAANEATSTLRVLGRLVSSVESPSPHLLNGAKIPTPWDQCPS